MMGRFSVVLSAGGVFDRVAPISDLIASGMCFLVSTKIVSGGVSI